ncbi:MAG: hypothetical protein ABJA85_01155 [Bacteroidota bacterium]
MNHPKQSKVWKVAVRNLATMLLLSVPVAGAFATLGDGKKKTNSSKNSLLSYKTSVKTGSFSLRSGYRYRGNEVINTTEKKYIRLNTTVTLQKGNTTYIVPLKKVILQNVKIELGNRQFKRN